MNMVRSRVPGTAFWRTTGLILIRSIPNCYGPNTKRRLGNLAATQILAVVFGQSKKECTPATFLGQKEQILRHHGGVGQPVRHRPGTGIGGFRVFTPGDDGGMAWRDEPGFLTGAAGVALALLGAITDVPPDWDRALLLS